MKLCNFYAIKSNELELIIKLLKVVYLRFLYEAIDVFTGESDPAFKQ